MLNVDGLQERCVSATFLTCCGFIQNLDFLFYCCIFESAEHSSLLDIGLWLTQVLGSVSIGYSSIGYSSLVKQGIASTIDRHSLLSLYSLCSLLLSSLSYTQYTHNIHTYALPCP